MSRPRAIRFSKEDEKLIEEFLAKNPIFDFSSLSRLAILNFIKNPKLELHAVKERIREIPKEDANMRTQ